MTTEIETTGTDPYDKIKDIEEIGLLHLKGYKNSEIAELTQKSPNTVREYIKLYKRHLEVEVENDPYFLEKVQYNTLKILAEMDEISKEAWESVDVASRQGMIAQRNQALKLALDVTTKKGQLLQLMGGQKSDGEYIARMQKAEQVNAVISKVIRDIVADCDICRPRAEAALREAFYLMDQDNDDYASDTVEVHDHEHIIEAEIVEE